MARYKPYEFKEDDAKNFASHVGIVTHSKGNELIFKKCPYCKGSGKDEKTFSINLKTGQYKCFRDSCGAQGNMITLARDFDFSLGNEIDEYYAPKKMFKKLTSPKDKIVPKQEAISYLESRGISKETASRYEITVQTENKNVLVFPFYDEKGLLQFVKYRKTDFDKEKDYCKEWCEKGCKPILFGMKQCNMENKTLVVTEGQIDSLSVAESGIENAVSVPTGSKGMTWVPYCWDFVHKFDKIIVFGDFEKGKITLLEDFVKRFKISVYHVREEDYMECKDANDILRKYGKEQVRKCIKNAIPIPVRNVIDLSMVESRDPFKIPKLATGVAEFDDLLYGGLPFGYVHILGGKRGDGKSTFGSQLICQAREQGYKSFVYSGEMENGDVKNWMYLNFAGDNHIIENKTVDGRNYWFISNQTSSVIDKWVQGNIFLYDNTQIDNEMKELIPIIIDMICREGVKVILLDNLMTAIEMMDVVGSDEYAAQKNFCSDLRKIALQYHVLIILVAHRRKSQGTTDVNDEISGSSYITNCAGVVVSYDRDKSEDGNPMDRKLVVSKNRLFGKLNYDGILLHFAEKSKRIYGDRDDKNFRYSWDKSQATDIQYGFEAIGIEDMPFGE